jgi:PPOX class probable F420-dependent enzyme
VFGSDDPPCSIPGGGHVARLDEDARRLLDGPNYGHLATLMPDGSPKVDPVWVGRDDDRVLVTTDGKSLKARNVRLDQRVALSIVDIDDPYDQLLVRGRVVELRADEELAVLDRLAEKYLGSPFPRRRWSERLVIVIEPHVARSYRSALRHRPPAKEPR